MWHTLVRKLALPMEGGGGGEREAAFGSCITYSFIVLFSKLLKL